MRLVKYLCSSGFAFIFRLFLLFIPLSLSAQDNINLKKFETPTLKLVFLDQNTSYLVPHTVRSFENALRFQEKFWNYKPSDKTSILFNDLNDNGSGGSLVLPMNFLLIGVAPYDYTFSVTPSNERIQWLMGHELTPQGKCDKTWNKDRVFRNIVGG